MLLQRLYRITNCNRILRRAVLYKNVHPVRKWENNMQIIRKLTIMSPFTVMGIWGFVKSNSDDKTQNAAKELLAKADTLFDQGNYRNIYNLLSNYKDSKDVEILWRLSRAIYKMSEMASDVEAQKLIYEGYDLLRKALAIQENHYALHKWISIFLNKKSILEGTKAHIKESYNIKKHMLRALELNPSDATLLYMVGSWCYEVSNLTWYQRKIASVVFGEPPTSTFEETLMYFEAAEKTDPNFYSHNLLMLGKTYLKLNRKEEAIKYLKKTAEFPAKNDEDQQAKQEAQKILNSVSK
ncbi:PREDICTED: regulator of microtubule dynamics protein 1-like isoform X1 [Trachymyrmex septentrionalis]|uniref:regulator of microtubule dynamics protein 1-like isoform X1 n=1 Tax=Trachymyrmex septentrionalis TaxID=34720 RepID=UPI00084F54F0|nr:PREDICTED: regulator of microtubule dynamics protein 1-like isoform X1 [Trachymyrmex septentrionalis]XP_018343483.1 PREDICTED: regulator of microtubule dynamics protein 1-like isoform X1 [Trachymyrmex septentrionalis]